MSQSVIPFDFISNSLTKIAEKSHFLSSSFELEDTCCCFSSQKCSGEASVADCAELSLHVMLHTAKISLRDYNGDIMSFSDERVSCTQFRVEVTPKLLPCFEHDAKLCFIQGIIRISAPIDEAADGTTIEGRIVNDRKSCVLNLASTIATEGIDNFLTGVSSFADSITYSKKSFPTLAEYFSGSKRSNQEKDVCFAPKDPEDLFQLAAAFSDLKL